VAGRCLCVEALDLDANHGEHAVLGLGVPSPFGKSAAPDEAASADFRISFASAFRAENVVYVVEDGRGARVADADGGGAAGRLDWLPYCDDRADDERRFVGPEEGLWCGCDCEGGLTSKKRLSVSMAAMSARWV
jgi:hypothetical protein